ncbi:MAG: trimethylamine methyltransferase family protein [Anaerolineae bacterium]|jgi:trimethylamine--corrinoid protein Co-methyltransferase
MKGNSTLHRTPSFRLLSEDQLEEIHLAGLEILRRTGVDVLEEEARELLKRAGASLDGLRARIPPHLVEWAIQVAPSRIVLCDSRDGQPRMHLESSKAYYGSGSDCIATIDARTGERRKPRKSDVANAARLCDVLPNIDFVMSMAIAGDVTEEVSDLHHFEAMVLNTRKPIIATAWNKTNLKDLVEMAEIVAGGVDALRENPFLVMYSEPVSPLQLGLEPTQKILYMAGKGLPVICGTGKVGGATCPDTIAGALAQGNAESLAGVLLAQLKREGAPIIFGGERLHLDMSTALCSYGAPEFMMSVAANAEMARYYGLPSWSYAGCSDAKTFDQQAAAESSLMTFLAALSGGNLNHDVGYLEAGLTSSLEAVVAANEVIGMVKRIMGGVQVGQETLALDVIHEVGPGGEFLTTDHTFRHFKDDWFPSLFERGSYEAWEGEGRKRLGQRANEVVRSILENHTPEPLPAAVQRELAQVVRRAEGRIGGG